MNYELIEGPGRKPVKAWVEGVVFEESARKQVLNVALLPFVHGVAIMPDVHAGIGSTVGSVIATKNVIIPSIVGVDIGCVDAETEFLSEDGWKFISEYQDGDSVMQYDPSTGQGEFVKPKEYIKKEYDKLYSFKTKHGINQVLSPDHTILCWEISGRDRIRVQKVITAEQFKRTHDYLVQGYKAEFMTTFTPVLSNSIEISDDNLRVMVMVLADGHIDHQNHAVVKVRKARKSKKAKELLDAAKIKYTEKIYGEDVSFRFLPPKVTKTYEWLWKASLAQLKIFTDECFHWDGNIKDRVFFTRIKEAADFAHYAFTASGYRAVLRQDEHYSGAIDYRVFAHNNTMVGMAGVPKSEITEVVPIDGRAYCFTLPSGYWVMRRGGNIAMTGNCGMAAVRTSLKAEDLPSDLKPLREAFERTVPVGFNMHTRVPSVVETGWKHLDAGFKWLDEKYPKIVNDKHPVNQLATLGGGNHFIELCLDRENRVWLMLHSGSRGIGNKIGSYFINEAKAELEKRGEVLPDKDLAFLSEGTDSFEDYVKAMTWAQDYAATNREVMLKRLLSVMREDRLKLPTFTIDTEVINCHHNYVTTEIHFGEEMYVSRKGAVRAGRGEMGIIPGSMGTKSYIVRGLGNAESYMSCSHGAGRVMSRTQAKKQFTVEDQIAATKGVECRKDIGVIDEIPQAYKDIDAVMAAQSDLVEVVHQIKQVLCVKG